MKIDEQDFDELRDLINEALQANWEAYNSCNKESNPAKEHERVRKVEEKLWEKFYDMRAIAKNNILHQIIEKSNSPFFNYTEETTIKESK